MASTSLSVYRAGGQWKLTVMSHPQDAALLGEHLLVEALPLPGLPVNARPLEQLRAAYLAIATELATREANSLIGS